MSKNIAIVLSGGVGSRMGADRPKQYLEVQGRPIIGYALQTFAECELIDALVIAVADEWKDFVAEQVADFSKPVYYAQAGETRQYSIYNALRCAAANGAADDAVVVIHDGARPFVSQQLIADCVNAVAEGWAGVLPVLPVKDTVYQSADGQTIDNLLPRHELFAGQAPEAFRLGDYLRLHDETPRTELLRINGSTELAFKAGWRVKIIKGEERNFKVTTPEDIQRMNQILTE